MLYNIEINVISLHMLLKITQNKVYRLNLNKKGK